jgi:hypothetical protein
MRGILIVILVAVAHSIAGVLCGIGELITSGFFDNIPTPAHPAFDSVRRVLEFPLLTIANMKEVTADMFILPLMIANSFLWGVVVYLITTLFGRYALVDPGRRR